MSARPTELRCVEKTAWADEETAAAVTFLGQLSGRLIAVEGPRDDEEYALTIDDLHRGAPLRAFCGRLWMVEDLEEADARAVGWRLLPGVEPPGWRVWVGGRDYIIWRDATCSRRSVKLQHEGAEWWRAQLHVSQRRDPMGLWLSDCTLDPAGVAHDVPIRYECD